MGHLLGAPVGQGSLATWAAQAGADLEGDGSFTAAVRDRLVADPVVHFDESGLRVHQPEPGTASPDQLARE